MSEQFEYKAERFGKDGLTHWGVTGPPGTTMETSINWGRKEAEFVAARYQAIHAQAVVAERARIREELLAVIDSDVVRPASPSNEPLCQSIRRGLRLEVDRICPEEPA